MNDHHKMLMLEQQMKVMQREVNDVIQGMFRAMGTLMEANKTALNSLQEQIDGINRHLGLFVEEPKTATETETPAKAEKDTGVEL